VGPSGTAEQAAEKVKSVTSAAKAADGNKGIIAALKLRHPKSRATSSFSAPCKAVPLQNLFLAKPVDGTKTGWDQDPLTTDY
jgi:hypothetical protein